MILRKNKSEKSRLTETSGHRIKVMAFNDIKKWIQDNRSNRKMHWMDTSTPYIKRWLLFKEWKKELNI
jgi:hypothetical protein